MKIRATMCVQSTAQTIMKLSRNKKKWQKEKELKQHQSFATNSLRTGSLQILKSSAVLGR